MKVIFICEDCLAEKKMCTFHKHLSTKDHIFDNHPKSNLNESLATFVRGTRGTSSLAF